ncbi:hypothetical protein HYT04_02295 [Candidatus Kaiserbacteria bacterium]|nr:hypothetical protein [Candidatus Kaiserbacteria bacterium]
MRKIANIALVLLAFTGCATAPASASREENNGPTANAPDIRVGDAWVDKVNGAEKTSTVTKTSEDTLTVNLWGTETVLTKEGNTLTGYSAFNRPISYSPYLDTFSFPLYPGKKWSSSWSWSGGGYRGNGSTYGKAGTWENISVPAGTFLAIRVDVTHSWESGSMTITYWYAPEVNRFVKYKGPLGSLELVTYRPAPR